MRDDEPRPIEVVGGQSVDTRREWASPDRTQALLLLIAVAAIVAAAGSVVTAWAGLSSREDARLSQCSFYDNGWMGSSDEQTTYAELPPAQQRIVDRLDCEVPGR